MKTKVDFQVEDKARKDKLQMSKLTDKQRNVEKLQNQIQMMDQDKLMKDTNKMLKMAGNFDSYEKINHF